MYQSLFFSAVRVVAAIAAAGIERAGTTQEPG